jgi:hypothetical protein
MFNGCRVVLLVRNDLLNIQLPVKKNIVLLLAVLRETEPQGAGGPEHDAAPASAPTCVLYGTDQSFQFVYIIITSSLS